MLQKPKSVLEIARIRLEQAVPQGHNEAPGPNPTGCPRADEHAQTESEDKNCGKEPGAMEDTCGCPGGGVGWGGGGQKE